MVNLLKRLPAGSGKNVNRKQLQDFIKEILFEKSLADAADIQTDYVELSGASFAVIQTVSEASKSGDFNKLKPLLDFAFDRERVKK